MLIDNLYKYNAAAITSIKKTIQLLREYEPERYSCPGGSCRVRVGYIRSGLLAVKEKVQRQFLGNRIINSRRYPDHFLSARNHTDIICQEGIARFIITQADIEFRYQFVL